MVKKKGFFIKGLPIHPRIKLISVIVLAFVLILNNILPRFITTLDCGFNGTISIILIGLIFVMSIGSWTAEGLVIGICTFALMSNIWDYFVRDHSLLRNNILIGSLVILSLSLIFGRISFWNLVSILRKQLGVEKR